MHLLASAFVGSHLGAPRCHTLLFGLLCLLQGARVVVSSRRQQNVEETVQQLRAEGLQVAGIACHVGDGAAIKARPAC